MKVVIMIGAVLCGIACVAGKIYQHHRMNP